MNILPKDVARYYLYRCVEVGELITPLKMQKLLYFAYAWTLVNLRKPIFQEKFEAWPNGPVIPSLYRELKKYGSSPINQEFMEISTEDDLAKLKSSFGEVLEILDQVYEKYIPISAFELVTITHNEKSWKRARKGLEVTQPSKIQLSDEDIIDEYGEKI